MAYIKRIKLPNVTESYDIYDPSAVHSVNNKTGTEITLSATDIGLGNVDNVKQYSDSNPPPYPVTSVNGKTGAVTIETGGGSGSSIPGQAEAPASQNVGDLWFKVV